MDQDLRGPFQDWTVSLGGVEDGSEDFNPEELREIMTSFQVPPARAVFGMSLDSDLSKEPPTATPSTMKQSQGNHLYARTTSIPERSNAMRKLRRGITDGNLRTTMKNYINKDLLPLKLGEIRTATFPESVNGRDTPSDMDGFIIIDEVPEMEEIEEDSSHLLSSKWSSDSLVASQNENRTKKTFKKVLRV